MLIFARRRNTTKGKVLKLLHLIAPCLKLGKNREGFVSGTMAESYFSNSGHRGHIVVSAPPVEPKMSSVRFAIDQAIDQLSSEDDSLERSLEPVVINASRTKCRERMLL